MVFFTILRLLIFLSCVPELLTYQSHHHAKYKTWTNSEHAPHRLLQIMASYTEEAKKRSMEMNEMRFMYEESPQYEQGYIMGEIIERFRKVVEHTKRPIEYKSDDFVTTLKRTGLIQVLYFEVYHLVRMMHEVPKKYEKELEFGSKKMSQKELFQAKKNIEEMQRRREKERRKRKRQNAKLREAYLRGLSQISEYGKKKKIYNQWWPIDYGWEIDYYW